jgi:hypothetical protein
VRTKLCAQRTQCTVRIKLCEESPTSISLEHWQTTTDPTTEPGAQEGEIEACQQSMRENFRR